MQPITAPLEEVPFERGLQEGIAQGGDKEGEALAWTGSGDTLFLFPL